MSEPELLADLSFENVRRHMEHICLEIPSRLAGTENARRAAQYNADALTAHGIDARVEDLPGLVSFPEPTMLQVITEPQEAIEAFTCGHSLPTGPEGISGELVFVGSGAESDYEGKSVAGRIVLAETSYHPARHEKLRIAANKGVLGVILMNRGGPENDAVPYGSVKPAWGNPTPETMKTEMPALPAIGIARTTGMRLKARCDEGPVRVRFQAIVENGWRQIQLTTGEVPSPASDDFVLLSGHQDSWFGQAATDNAAGNACIVELARVLNLRRDRLRRGLACGFWTAHETGTMVGSSWYADRNWDRLRRHCCAYMQIDQPACVGTTRWGTGSNVQLRRFHQSVEARHLGNMEYHWHRLPKGGDASFMGLGIPAMYGIGHYTEQELADTGLARLGWWHHSIECNMDKIDLDFLATHLKVYAGYLWGLCTEAVLPFDFADAAAQFVDRLDELQAPGKSIGLDGALDRARDFHAAASAFDASTATWRARYGEDPSLDEAPANALNEAMKSVNRLLIPMASTAKGTYGHDPYGYTPQGSMIPVLHDVPKLADLPENETRWMLETELVRARNQVADALTDAADTLRRATAGIG